ncbi:MAG: HAD hydrolase-like protein [Acidimicrobiia bacterium]|nr:HAD hydrolase-like protein [Acidimicrobiia bacterium]
MHIVWDWNGTLLDDLTVVIEAANISLGRLGAPPIDEDTYRDHFTRPVRAFYDSLFGRPVTDEEWHALNNTFHVEYMARADQARLTHDAAEALAAADAKGWAQSLLSMSPQEWLEGIVDRKGVADRFVAVDGLRAETGGLKANHLDEHLSLLGLEPRATVVVGDTPDDAVAARHVGAHIILYDGGSHHLPTLEGMGAPIAHTLVQAVELATRL